MTERRSFLSDGRGITSDEPALKRFTVLMAASSKNRPPPVRAIRLLDLSIAIDTKNTRFELFANRGVDACWCLECRENETDPSRQLNLLRSVFGSVDVPDRCPSSKPGASSVSAFGSSILFITSWKAFPISSLFALLLSGLNSFFRSSSRRFFSSSFRFRLFSSFPVLPRALDSG